MGQIVNKVELSKKLSRNSFLNQRESLIIVEELFGIILETLKSGKAVSVVGFGKFYLYEHAARPVRNPKTQEEMTLKSYKSLKFKTSPVIKELLKDLSYSGNL